MNEIFPKIKVQENSGVLTFNKTHYPVFLAVGIIVLMLNSNRILYFRILHIPNLITYGVCLFFFLIHISNNLQKYNFISIYNFSLLVWLAIIFFYDWILVQNLAIVHLFYIIVKLTGIFLVLSLNVNNKLFLFNLITKTISILVGIALIGWILLLIGIPIPHFTVETDLYYTHTIYYFFNLNGYPEDIIIPRFAGPFLEPGHLGTICVFLLFLNDFRLKNKYNIILLLGILFSLSLAAYGLLVGAIIFYLIQKKLFTYLITSFIIFALISITAYNYNNGDNVINQAILLRLEINDDGDISGNNRTSPAFDNAYEKFWNSDDVIFGVGSKVYGERKDGIDNLTIGTATYKRYVYIRGIIGTLLILVFLFYYWYKNQSFKGFNFLILYIIANCIRDYPTMELWLYLYLLSIPIFSNKNKKVNLQYSIGN